MRDLQVDESIRFQGFHMYKSQEQPLPTTESMMMSGYSAAELELEQPLFVPQWCDTSVFEPV